MTQENPADRRPVDDVLADMDDIIDNWRGSPDAMRWSPDRDVENTGWTGGGFFYFDGGPVDFSMTWAELAEQTRQGLHRDATDRWVQDIGGWSDNAPTSARAHAMTPEDYREAFRRVVDRVRNQRMGDPPAQPFELPPPPRDTPTTGRVEMADLPLEAGAGYTFTVTGLTDDGEGGTIPVEQAIFISPTGDGMSFIRWAEDVPTMTEPQLPASRYQDDRPRHESPYGPRRRGRR